MRILLTAVGKRIQLITHLKKSLEVFGADCSDLAPAMYFVDRFFKIPRYDEKGYIDILAHICESEKIDILVPLYEREYKLLLKNEDKLIQSGTKLLLSPYKTIECFNDKYKTYEFFRKNNINTPKTWLKSDISYSCKTLNFPLIIKPIDGMGSSNVFKAKNRKELEFFIDYIENPIVQEYIEGTEYTIDVLCDFNGKVISVVPRERIEVRSGEVSKSRTVKDFNIIDAVINLCSKTKFVGPITIQCIVTLKGEIKFIEVNPRFGGGVPLTFEAGVDYGKYFELMIKGEKIVPIIGEFKELTMLRYDEAVFL